MCLLCVWGASLISLHVETQTLYTILDFFLTAFFKLLLLFINFREREGRETERKKHQFLLFHLFMHSLVDSCMCPDQGWNPQPWYIRMML